MGYNSKRFSVVKVDLGDEYWAEVAPLTKAEDDACQRALLGGELEGEVGSLSDLRATLHQRDYTDQLLVFAIKRWNLDDEDGSSFPIDLPHVQGLADADATKLVAAVRRLNQPVSASDPKGSSS